MTTSIEKIAIQLADETLKRTDETGNERLYYDVIMTLQRLLDPLHKRLKKLS
jgi:hypothetical protein